MNMANQKHAFFYAKSKKLGKESLKQLAYYYYDLH